MERRRIHAGNTTLFLLAQGCSYHAAMSPLQRRILQACLYEGIAIAVVTPTLALAFSHPPGSAFVLAAVMSSIALAWNYVFNSLFERWEARQTVRGQGNGPIDGFVDALRKESLYYLWPSN